MKQKDFFARPEATINGFLTDENNWLQIIFDVSNTPGSWNEYCNYVLRVKQFNQPSSPMPSQSQKPQFNLKYILIVLGLAVIAGGGILAYQYWWLPKYETKLPEITISNPTASWQTYTGMRITGLSLNIRKIGS